MKRIASPKIPKITEPQKAIENIPAPKIRKPKQKACAKCTAREDLLKCFPKPAATNVVALSEKALGKQNEEFEAPRTKSTEKAGTRKHEKALWKTSKVAQALD